MARRVHPDELDRVAASGATATASRAGAASPDEAIEALRRILVTGTLRRIPRNPRQRDILLATLCLDLRRRHAYTEVEMNEHLRTVLGTLRATVDHVTCRRFLVDLDFLRRDRAGKRYLLNFPRLEATLSSEAARAIGEHLRSD
jgi:hypothetical protein